MATLQLKLEQVNFESNDIHQLELEDPIFNVVDPNTDFYSNIVLASPIPSNSAISLDLKEASSNCASNPVEALSPASVSGSLIFDDVFTVSENVITTPQCLPEVHATKGKQVSNNRRGHSFSDSISYPNLSSKVAQHMYQTNPLILKNVEMALAKSELMNRQTVNDPIRLENGHSNLTHLATTSEALALQESVIGKKSIQPASPQEVAELVSKVRNGNSHSRRNSEINSVQPARSERTTNSNESLGSNPQIGKELHRIPADQIVTITEKNSWFSRAPEDYAFANNVATQLALSTQRRKMRKGSRKSCSSRSSSISAQDNSFHSYHNMLSTELNCDDMPRHTVAPDTELMLAIKNSKGQHGSHSPRSEVDSNYSERFELDSNFSEQLETQSNFSEMSNISGIEEEMFRIKKLLLEVPALPDDHPDFQKHSVMLGKSAGIIMSGSPEMARAVVDQDVFFELQRHKANLEGQLEYLKAELDEAVNERSSLQTMVASMHNQIKTCTIDMQLNNTEKQDLLTKLKTFQESCRLAEITMSQLKQSVESKTNQLNSVNEDLKEIEASNVRLKLDAEELKMSVDSKESVIQGLKSKLTEVYVELQTSNQAKIQMDNSYGTLKSDVEALLKSREWYQQQLHTVQDSFAKMQQEFISLQGKSVHYNSNAEKLRTENMQIRQQLVETQQRSVKEKEVLMRHLQTIEADMLEREATFEHIQRDKGMAEESLLTRMKKVEEEKSKLTNLVFNVADLEHQQENMKKELEFKDQTIKKIEKDFSELMKQYTIAQKTINEQNLELNSLERKFIESENKCKEYHIHISNKDEYIGCLKDEKVAVEIALAAANKEKVDVDEALKTVKDNLKKLEMNFKKMRNELANKTLVVDQLQRENRKLEELAQASEQQSMAIRVSSESHNKDLEQRDGIICRIKKEHQENMEKLHAARQELECLNEKLSTSVSCNEKLEAELREFTKGKSSLEENLKKSLQDKQEIEEQMADLKLKLEKKYSDEEKVVMRRNSMNQQPVENATSPLQKVAQEKKKLKDDIMNLESSLKGVEYAINNSKQRRNSHDLSDGTIILCDRNTEDKICLQGANVSAVREELEQELAQIRQALKDNEKWVETYMEEKRSLEFTVEKLSTENKCLHRDIAIRNLLNTTDQADDYTLKDYNISSVTQEIIKHKQKIQELEDMLKVYSDASSVVVEEDVELKTLEANTQTDNVSFMKHVLQQDDELRDISCKEVAHLEAVMAKLEQDQKERNRIYESNIKLLTRKLKETMKIKKKLEAELKDLQGRVDDQSAADKLIISTPSAQHATLIQYTNHTSDPSSSGKQRDLKREIFHYRGKVKHLQLKLSEMEEICNGLKRKAEANEQLTLELEKEKGRLEGASESNLTLKQHTNELEAALAQKDVAVSVMDFKAKDQAYRQHQEAVQVKEQVQELEVALAAEQESAKELRKQVFNAKREVSALKKQISSLKTGLDNANNMIEGKNGKLQMMESQLVQTVESQRTLQIKYDSLHSTYQLLKEQEHLKQTLHENEIKDSLLAEQIKTLSWHMKAKNQELEAMKDHLKFIETRHAAEIQTLKKTLQECNEDLENTKAELSNIMEEKFAYQTKLTEIRAALQAAAEQNSMLKKQIGKSDQENRSSDFLYDLNIPESPTPFNEELIVSLLQQTSLNSPSRPLSNLQSCLHTLKQEMEILQKQIEENS